MINILYKLLEWHVKSGIEVIAKLIIFFIIEYIFYYRIIVRVYLEYV